MNKRRGSISMGLAILVCLPLLGCGGQSGTDQFAAALEKAESPEVAEGTAVALMAGGDAVDRSAGTRKIIYTADIDLVVDDFAVLEREISGVISMHRGFVAERQTDRRHGDHRGGTWLIRVPVDHYDPLLAGLNALGFARSRSETSDDVTESYVDLQARISNKRKLEERIIAMLQERPGKLSELMEIERELSRVREEIERMEGRMRVLADQTSLATIKLNVFEEATYEPPSAPTLGQRIAATWGGSITTIRQIGSGLVIAVVAIVPWLAIALPMAGIGYRVRNRIAGR